MKISISEHFTYSKLIRFVLPSIIMMIFTSIYGVVDGLFVSNYVGKNAFAAMNLIIPFTMILGSIGFMVGTGGTALITKTLGQGDRQRAKKYFTMLVFFTIIMGVILTIFGISLARPIAYLCGATENLIDTCVLYGRIVIGFTTFFMLQNVFQNFLVANEKPQLGLIITVIAGVTNMVLDALFIVVFKWGVAGAALATGISQFVGGFLPLLYFVRYKDNLLGFTRLKFELKPILATCINGSSELMSNISVSLVSVVYNLQLLKYVGENGVSAYGVLMYVQFIFIAIFMGYTIGSAPIIGYNFGSGNYKELQNMFKKSLFLISITGVVLAITDYSLSGPIASIFVGYDKELLELTKYAFKFFALSFLLVGFNIFASGFFTALNDGLISALLSFSRTLIFELLAVLLIPLIFGKDFIWLSNFGAEVLAVILTMILFALKRKRYKYI